ncbi:MAG TPA: type II toxin-antitoxin system VapC family toxin [Caulobacteraceae bacterium]|jgi:predicted nucleic acid-binding protein
MPDEAVLDASVAAKVFIEEEGSAEASAYVLSGVRFIAPELVLIEVANVVLKRFRRGELPRMVADHVARASRTMFDELVPADKLVPRAFELAADHGLSVYDSMYVALAEARHRRLVTADARLIAKMANAKLAVETWTP